ncbi:uncharacterized protein LOC101849022 [Aplysia californica]|uniref:Uncharacterized protein LOC101849022 n=1 Tax=Aplysia californica TaxID=6500 RepID=A0ABM0KAE1_APLCA|nr:uncharacterized protein LOC101849022 [Aplysia californica]
MEHKIIKMYRVTSLLLFSLICLCVHGIVITPKEDDPTVYTHCVNSQEPILINDPFPPSLAESPDFVAFSWFMDKDEDKKISLLDYIGGSWDSFETRVEKYKFWGLQVKNVQMTDSATYRAVLAASEEKTKRVNIVVAQAPRLSSSTLEVTRRPNPDKRTFVLSCGQVESLGEPPADIVWKASNGTRLPTSFQDGYLMLTLDVNEDYGEYTCQLDWESPAAKCIPEEEKDMWTGSISLSSSSSSPDMTMIIVAVVVAVVVVIVVVVVIMIWVKRCRGKGNTYNAKEHEAKVTMANRSNADPLLEDPEAKPTSPIYKGPPTDRVDTANPYMVSNIRPYSSEVDAGSRKPLAPKASHEDSKVNGGKTPAGEEKKKQPKAKPRSIFLTPSMEALDAIGKSDGRDDPGTAV